MPRDRVCDGCEIEGSDSVQYSGAVYGRAGVGRVFFVLMKDLKSWHSGIYWR